MERIISKILKTDFNKNVLILSGGTVISQVLLVAFSPILTRIYTPDAFGLYAVFLSLIAIIGSNICLKYDLAIMLPRKAEDVYKLSYLANYINITLSTILLIIIIIGHNFIIPLLHIQHSNIYLFFLLPLAIYFVGFNSILVNLNNRLKNYKPMAVSNIAKNGTMIPIQIFLSFLKAFSLSGLIIGQLAAYLSGNRILKINSSFSFRQMFQHKLHDFKNVSLKYREFPYYAFPAGIANSASLNIASLLMTSIYSISFVGFFALAYRILSAPSILISRNVAQVYYQEACEEIRTKGNCYSVFKSTLKKLTILAIFVFVPLFFSSEYLFPLIFGNEWSTAGTIAKYLTILSGVRFIASSLSYTLNVAEKQKLNLVNNSFLLITNLVIFYLGYIFKINFIDFIKLYSFGISFLYLIFLLSFFLIAKKTRKIPE